MWRHGAVITERCCWPGCPSFLLSSKSLGRCTVSGSVRARCSLGSIGLGCVQKETCQYCSPRTWFIAWCCASMFIYHARQRSKFSISYHMQSRHSPRTKQIDLGFQWFSQLILWFPGCPSMDLKDQQVTTWIRHRRLKIDIEKNSLLFGRSRFLPNHHYLQANTRLSIAQGVVSVLRHRHGRDLSASPWTPAPAGSADFSEGFWL